MNNHRMKRFSSIINAFKRAKLPIATLALVYTVSVLVGVGMVHSGNKYAIDTRDGIVANAKNSPITIAYRNGNLLGAALLDYGSNLFFGAIPETGAGLGIVFPYPIAAYRGWVGGIVSIDSDHLSRLAKVDESLYYVSVLVLQLIPYSLAGGAGVNLGLAYFHPPPHYKGDKWFGIPKEAIRDTLRIYVLVLPLFLVASLVEFLA